MINSNNKNHLNGYVALVTGAVASLVGVAYYSYIATVSVPIDGIRLVPLLWLACSLWGLLLTCNAVLTREGIAISVAGFIVAVPNTLISLIFVVAALMGD